MKRIWIAALVFSAVGCAHLPPTNLPVCDEHDWGHVCRAPVRCLVKQTTPTGCCDKTEESFQDLLWERGRMCPVLTPIEGQPNFGSCYVYRGVLDSRVVYEHVVRTR